MLTTVNGIYHFQTSRPACGSLLNIVRLWKYFVQCVFYSMPQSETVRVSNFQLCNCSYRATLLFVDVSVTYSARC